VYGLLTIQSFNFNNGLRSLYPLLSNEDTLMKAATVSVACLAEKQQIPILWFDLSGLELTIYHTRGVHVNHYTTDTVAAFINVSSFDRRGYSDLKPLLKLNDCIVSNPYTTYCNFYLASTVL
jgi:hypothetical protein